MRWQSHWYILAFSVTVSYLLIHEVSLAMVHRQSLYHVKKWKENEFEKVASEHSVRLDNMFGFPDIGYAINIKVGTPPQQVMSDSLTIALQLFRIKTFLYRVSFNTE